MFSSLDKHITTTMAKYILGFVMMSSLIAHSAQYGQMNPSGTLIQMEHATIEISCSMYPTPDYSIDSLIFNISSSKPIPPNELTKHFQTIKVNETTKLFRTIDAPVFEGNIDCKLGKVGINRVTVNVGTKPTEVIDFKCISANWDNLTCSFERPYNPVPSSYQLLYALDTKPNFTVPTTECLLNPDFQRRFNCELKFESSAPYRQSYEYYFFRLYATNQFGNLTEDFTINNYNIVVPDPPKRLPYTNETSNSVVLNWDIPLILTNLPRQFVYKIHYRSQYDAENKWIQLKPFPEAIKDWRHRSRTMSHLLTDLPYAHTWYDYRIWLKVKDAADTPEMWSNYTSGSFQTAKRLPDHPPATDIGAFSFTDSGHIFIYWKSLKEYEYNGNGLGYTVTEVHNATIAPKTVEKTLAKFEKVDAFTMIKALEFEIFSINDVGKSKQPSRLRVPAVHERCEPPTNIKKIRVNSTTYNLSWIPPNRGPNITSYTIFWCESPNESPSHCKESIDFQRVSSDILHFQLKTNSTMNFAISANSMKSSSGMVWAMCTVFEGNEINKLTSIYMIKTQSTYIEFKWNLACIDRSILSGYTLEYCPIKDPKTEECKEPIQSHNISSVATEYILDKLKPYTTYKTRIRMLSENSKGPWSDSLVNTTLEDAPTPPLNLKAHNITNSSVSLTWDAPETINGVLVKYLVSYNGNESSVEKTDGTDHPLILNGLESFKHYEVVVRACTVSCSTPSNPVRFKTGVGLPGTMSQPSVPKDGNHLQWQPPLKPGGRLQYYELRIEMKTNDNQMQERIIKINGTKCTLPRNLCDIQSGKLYFSVRAVNVLHSAHADDHIHRMYGNDHGHLVKRDLAQKYIDVDSVQKTNENAESNLLKRHSKPEIESDLRKFNSNHKFDEKPHQIDHTNPTSEHIKYDAIGDLSGMKQICKEEYDEELEKYLAADRWPQTLPGKWSESWSTQCNGFRSGGFYFILVFLIIFTMAFVYGSFFAMKKLKKMKDISVELPAGLEDIREETKAKHLDDIGINVRDDVVHSLDYVHSNEQEQSLLRSRMESASSNSSENNSQCEYNEGVDNSTEYDQHTEDDSVQTMSENLDEKSSPTILLPVQTNALQSHNVFTSNPSSPAALIPTGINESQRAPIIDNSNSNRNAFTSTPPSTFSRPNPPPLTSNGYVTHAAIMGNQPVSSGYLPLSALVERKQTDNSRNTDDMKTKTPLQSPDIPGISGYVTHKQLSDFGQLMH